MRECSSAQVSEGKALSAFRRMEHGLHLFSANYHMLLMHLILILTICETWYYL